LRIQFFAEQALRKAVLDTGALSGTAVVMDPRSGEVLAMACMPNFNPNSFRKFGPGHWRNRVITDVFEPGSTIKAFLLAVALEENIVNEATRLDCEEGSYHYGGRVIHDLKASQVITVREIMMRSSNIGITKIADSVGRENLWQCLEAFGFGNVTGINLPGEVSGSLRNWRSWKKISLATHAFGQGFSVTALQLACAFSALANGGFLFEPFIVQEIRDKKNGVVLNKKPKVIRRVVSKQTADRVIKVLEAVVAEGTGKMAGLPGFRVAGKTGTAQKYDRQAGEYSSDRSVVSFVGVVPVDNPQMVIAVVLDEPEGRASGGRMAAPVFREIASRSLNLFNVPEQLPVIDEPALNIQMCSLQNVPADRRMQRPAERSERHPEHWVMPAVMNLPLRSAIRALIDFPFALKVEGSGRIVSQRPKPGAFIERGQTLWLSACSENDC